MKKKSISFNRESVSQQKVDCIRYALLSIAENRNNESYLLLYRDLFEDKSALILWQYYKEKCSALNQEAIEEKIKDVFVAYNDIKLKNKSAELQIKAMMRYFSSLIDVKR